MKTRKKGWKISEAHKKAISLHMKGKKFSAKHIENLRISHLGQVSWNKNRTKVNCIICGKEREFPQYRIRDNVRYCSLKCKGIDMRGKPSKLKGIKCPRRSPATEFKKGSIPWNYKGGISKTKEYKRFFRNNRRFLKKANGGKFSFKEWTEIKEKYNHTCLCCNRKEPDIKLTVDHILALTKGGRNSIENIQPLCVSCNSRKNTKFIDYRKKYETC